MKKFQLEVWNTFDKLCLMSAITKLKTSFADQNWVAISRYTKQLHENISSFIQYDNRSDEWFSAKQCSAQYEVLIKGSGARKKKKIDRNVDYSDVHEALLVSINQEFCEELQLSLMDIRDEYLQTKHLIEDIDNDKIDDERLDELITELLEKEKVSDIKTKLKSMLDEKNAVDCESSAKYLSQTLLPNEPSTSSEHKAANITTSPLLTSLLQSPSPLVRPSPSTSSPTISLLLHSSPSVSLTDPTLSKLLETPTTLPGTSTISSLESSSFLFQGTMLDSQQSSSETKRKQLEAGEEVSVQRVINDSEEFQRTEGFDDMSDIEQGVVESEVIIENESSPIKRLTPRRLDLENIGDEEPEEEILETVEEIIERVEEAIIETVGENNLNELVLNEGIDTVSISDDEMENINIEDNTYEVIVVGSQDEAVASSNEVSDSAVIVERSISKVDKIKNIENVKNSEIFSVDDEVRIEDAITKSVDDQNVVICNEVSLIKDSNQNEKLYDEKGTKSNNGKCEIDICEVVDQEISSKLIIQKEKPVPNDVISIHEKCLEKQSEDDRRLCDLKTNSGLAVKEKSFAVDSNMYSDEQVEILLSSSSEGDNNSISGSFTEIPIDKPIKDINKCQQNIPNNDSVPNTETIIQMISVDNKDDKPIEKKLTEEVELVSNENEVKVKSHDEIVMEVDTTRQLNTIEVNNDDSNRILELKADCLTNIPQDVLKGRGEKEQLELHNDVLKEGLNDGTDTEEAFDCDKNVLYISALQSVAISSLSYENETTEIEVSAKHNHLSKDIDKKTSTKPENEELVEAKGSCKDCVIGVDSDSGSSEELAKPGKEAENTPILNSNLAGESNADMYEKKTIISNQIEYNSTLGISNSECEQDKVDKKNEPLKDENKTKKMFEVDHFKEISSISEDGKKSKVENSDKNTSSTGIAEEIHEAQQTCEVDGTDEVQETHKAQETIEVRETHEFIEIQESQETPEIQGTPETQESHDSFYERSSSQIYVESDESKSDSTEETEDNSILTTEESKDGLDDSLKFSSLETLSVPSVDSPPEYNDPKFAGLTSKEKEFRSLIGKGFEELKNKAAELVFIPDTSFEDKTSSRKHPRAKNKPRIKKDKPFKTKKMAEKTNWEKSSDNKTPKGKPSKDRAGKNKPSNEKYTNSGRKSKYLSSFDSKPDSPSLSTTSSDEDRDYKSWKKSILLVYNRLASHKYASVFSKPITENEAPSYHQIILRPMDLSTIKRNIENGVIRTTVEFQRDMLLMVQNAIIYNKFDTPVYDMAKAMGEDMLAQMEVMVQALGDGVPLIGDTSEEKQITRARTSKSSGDTPQTKKRKTQEPDEIRPKRNKLSTSC